jgi:hypothetical protein
MAVFGPYTQPVKPAEWVDPLDLNLYAKGTAYKQDLAERNLQNITDAYNSLFSKNVYGPDKRKLAELEEQFKQDLNSLNISNLADMGTVSQIRGLIGKYSNNPEALAGIKRGAYWDSELEKKQKAEEKGEYYTSPPLTTLENYFNQDNFYEKPEGVNLTQGWVSPPIQKWMKEAREAVKKKVLNTKTGVLEEVVDPVEARDYFMQLASADPRFSKQISWDFELATKGTDWENEGQNYIVQKQEEIRAKLNQARLTGDTDGELLATRELQRLSSMANPKLIGDELRTQYQDSWLQNEMDKVGYSIDQTSFVDYKIDPVYMERLRTSNNILEAKYKAYLDAGIDPTTKEFLTTKDGRTLSSIKQAEKIKEEKAKSTTQKERDIAIVINAINSQGKVTADHVNKLADRGEVVVLNPNNTVKINYGEYWDEVLQRMVLPSQNSVTIPLEDYIKNRTGIDIKLKQSSKSLAGTTTTPPVKITRPQ